MSPTNLGPNEDSLVPALFAVSGHIRYVAVYRDGELTTRARTDLANASGSESDRYEELLVNPTLLKLASQRGEIDCGGLDYLLVRYGHFFQLVLPQPWGHVSVCIESDGDVLDVVGRVRQVL